MTFCRIQIKILLKNIPNTLETLFIFVIYKLNNIFITQILSKRKYSIPYRSNFVY